MTTHILPQAPAFAPQSAFISFRGPVNKQSGDALLSTLTHVVGQQVTDLHLLISTVGGSVDDGLHLYAMLQLLPFELTTYNVGNVDSIGNMIFLAGSKRYALPTASFMFHGIGLEFQQARLEKQHLKVTLASVKKGEARISEVIAKQTGMTKKRARGLLNEPKFVCADEAKVLGIVHDVVDFKIPPGALFHQLVF